MHRQEHFDRIWYGIQETINLPASHKHGPAHGAVWYLAQQLALALERIDALEGKPEKESDLPDGVRLCAMCGHKIRRHPDGYWEHIDCSPRHPGTPAPL